MKATQFLSRVLQGGTRRLGLQIQRYPLEVRPDRMLGRWSARLHAEQPVRLIFDVGANRGQTIKWLRRHFKGAAIHAFEPFGVPFAALQQYCADKPEVVPVQLALGDQEGAATLYENSNDTTNSLLPNSSLINTYAPNHMVIPGGQTTVPVQRLDAYCAQRGIRQIDVLKIDAQGYELNILEGAGEMLRPDRIRSLVLELLFVEYYVGQAWADDLLAKLRRHGYRLYGLSNVDFDPAQGWRWADALFIGVEGAGP